MAAGSDGNDRKEAASSQSLTEETTTTMRQLLTTSSIGTLTSPSLSPSLSSSSSDPPGDSLHVPSRVTLTFDLEVEILCRLPVKSLMQLRCVCKSWNSLISDPKFAKKHLRHSQMLSSRHHLVLCRRDCNSEGEFLIWDSRLPSVFNSSSILPETQLSYPLNIPDCYDIIIGSCDGILCFATGKDYTSVLVWNPSIRKFKILPPLEIIQLDSTTTTSDTIHGFGYDHFTDNYKVVAVCWYQRDISNWVCETQVKIHTLGTNSWRRIQGFPSSFLGLPDNDSGKFVSGTINWLVSSNVSRSSYVIVSLDLGMESYQELLQPDYGGVPGSLLTLGVLRDCLCILSHSDTFLDVWVMKDYGNKESWTKLFTVPYMELRGYESRVFANACYISEDDQLLLDLMARVVVYNSRSGTVKIPETRYIFSGWFDSGVYFESLISP